uniref:Secreted protein n=1 Tax=Rhipicephalus microplus TaxID=6941 RepID=A0A6M2DC23_RHIMP
MFCFFFFFFWLCPVHVDLFSLGMNSRKIYGASSFVTCDKHRVYLSTTLFSFILCVCIIKVYHTLFY